MLQNTKELYGHQLAASDGDIGHVRDFYFDDKSWAVRYLVADTGGWLTGRQVLLSTHALGHFDAAGKIVHVNLTRKQIEDSPSIETHRPVSRQFEAEYFRYYGWPVYWVGDGYGGLGGMPAVIPPMPDAHASAHHGHNQRDDLHLRSTKSMDGYELQATDGTIGALSGFKFNATSWTIRDLTVECHWYSGAEILIPTDKITHISYEDSKVFVNLTKADIQQTAENQVAKAVA